MTIVITYLSTNNAKFRRYQQRAKIIARRKADAELARQISKAWAKLTRVNWSEKQFIDTGSVCLPSISLYHTLSEDNQKKNRHMK